MSRHDRRPQPRDQDVHEQLGRELAAAEDASTEEIRAAYPFGYGARGLTDDLPMIRRENVGQEPAPDLPARQPEPQA